MELQRNFLSGVMNKDLDPHFLPDGTYRDAMNIIVGDSESSNDGAAQNLLGNTMLNSDLGLVNARCIGALSYDAENLIYWLVTSDLADVIYEYNELLATTTVVLRASKGLTTKSILNFNKDYPITGINYINGLLFWTDNYNPPRRINISRCKSYPTNGFTESDINVIVKPPISGPIIGLTKEGDATSLDNRFIYFAYRYKYVDNEYSALSPFSPVAFSPKTFAYDYGVSENISMVNTYNTANVSFNSGDRNVKEIQLIYRDTYNLNAYVIDNIVKADNFYADNQIYTYTFKNDKVYTVLPQDQINRLFDNVPLRAKSQELIGSRLVYGNYTQFFSLNTCLGTGLDPAFSLSLTTSNIELGVPKPTFKSNRDYEIGLIYLDDYGRSTTVITPTANTNTITIPGSNSTKANNIRVTISGSYNPPCFATSYRLTLKQNKQDYYNIYPITYFIDGQFKWFLINQSDQDKISVGSYFFSKTPTNPAPDTRYKVLDLAVKSLDFLGNDTTQPAGVYFKTKINDTALPALYSYSNWSAAGVNPGLPINNPFVVAEKAIFYGKGLNDMITSNGNIFTSTKYDARFYIEIAEVGLVDKFAWYIWVNGEGKKYVGTLSITAGVNQLLSYTYTNNNIVYTISCTIRFATATGHTASDFWTIMGRAPLTGGFSIFGGDRAGGASYPIVTMQPWQLDTNSPRDRPIEAGALVTFSTKYNPEDYENTVNQSFVATGKYTNIEEWFIEDGVYSKLKSSLLIDGEKDVQFRRVNALPTSNTNATTNQGGSISATTLNNTVAMYFQGGGGASLYARMTVIQQSALTILETVPSESNQDIYYELSKTYPIVNGNHVGNVQNQITASNTPAIIDLNTFDINSDFNAFCFGNGVESIQIRDDFNSPKMEFSPRANSTIEGYDQQTLVQALTYSGVYQQTTAVNRLNEFNLSLGNFKYLDRFFGSIQKLYSRDTDLVVFQENKVSKVLYGKNLLSDSTGGGVVASIPEVLGTQISYVGEYGISNNPESFARWGNNLFFTDARRGAVLALQGDGLFEISSRGMKNWFKANLNTNTQKLGMFDPYFEQYIVSNNNISVKVCNFSLSNTTVVVSGNGVTNGFGFNIDSNTSWTIATPSVNWITVSDSSGNGSQTINITVLENLSSARQTTLTVTNGCGPSKQVIIKQNETCAFTGTVTA
jgi:hypothetical protein